MSLPFEVERRLDSMIDRTLYGTDAQYHAEIARLKHLLHLVEMALEDEGLDHEATVRVLNRIVYGTPSGADAYKRIEMTSRLTKDRFT